jgi:hypothetical protein
MSFNFATVIQSDNPLTQNLYTEEFANVVKTPKNNFREAVDMEKYHTEMYELQLEENKKKRFAVEQDAAKRVADYNKMTKKLKDRYNKFLEKHKNDGWEGLENHWYWKHYFSNINKPGYTNLDNQLDNMKEDRFHPIELSKDGYYKIGEFENTTNISTNFVENPAIYKSPYGEYIYDHDDDLLYPPQKEQDTNNLVGDGSKNDDKSLIDDAFNLKQKELIREVQKNKTSVAFSSNIENKTKSEEFTSVDPKLAEIYQKTLLTPTPTQPPKRNLLFNYIYCLIFILFLFLVFKST